MDKIVVYWLRYYTNYELLLNVTGSEVVLS